jgi:hypothetical protein
MIGSRLVARSLSHPLTDPCQFDMIVQDKKVKRGKLTFILARDRRHRSKSTHDRGIDAFRAGRR